MIYGCALYTELDRNGNYYRVFVIYAADTNSYPSRLKLVTNSSFIFIWVNNHANANKQYLQIIGVRTRLYAYYQKEQQSLNKIIPINQYCRNINA